MKKANKVLAMLLSAAMVASLAACGGKTGRKKYAGAGGSQKVPRAGNLRR